MWNLVWNICNFGIVYSVQIREITYSTSIIDKMKRKQIPKTIKFIVHNYASTVQILIIDPDYYQYMLQCFFQVCIVINHENYSYINDLNTNQLLEEGIMFQQGEKWKQQRELYIQYFNLDKLKNNIPPINEIIQKHIKQYDQQNDKIQTLLLRIMSDILILSFFGEDANKLQINKKCIGLETIELFQALQTLSSKPYSICKTILFGVQALKMFPNSEEQIIQTRINNIKFQIEKTIQKRIVQHELKLDEDENEISKMSDDFLNIYIQTYLQSKKGNNKISLEEIKQQFFTFFRIGIQTTTQIIYSSLHYLAEQPEIQNELRQEIMSIGEAEIIQFKELNSYVHLSAFFNEVLRFINPIPIVRKVQTSHFIKDLKLDRDWVILIDYSVSNFQEKYYDTIYQCFFFCFFSQTFVLSLIITFKTIGFISLNLFTHKLIIQFKINPLIDCNPKEFNYKRWLQSKSIIDIYILFYLQREQ